MKERNSVFIATSIDGFVSDRNGGLDWLQSIPNPENNDMGYSQFMSRIDALVMGRVTFETVCGFDIEWPYDKPVFVLSRTLEEVPLKYKDKVYIVKSALPEVLKDLHQKGYRRLYIDGGATIQSFLNEDLIDELIITTFPILLGGGAQLFTVLPCEQQFDLVKSEVFLNQVVQNSYMRKRNV